MHAASCLVDRQQVVRPCSTLLTASAACTTAVAGCIDANQSLCADATGLFSAYLLSCLSCLRVASFQAVYWWLRTSTHFEGCGTRYYFYFLVLCLLSKRMRSDAVLSAHVPGGLGPSPQQRPVLKYPSRRNYHLSSIYLQVRETPCLWLACLLACLLLFQVLFERIANF